MPKPTGGVLGIYGEPAGKRHPATESYASAVELIVVSRRALAPGFETMLTTPQLRWHVPQRVIRQHERTANQLRVVVEKVRKPHPGQQRDRKHFLYSLFELEERHDLPALNVNNPRTAGPLRFLQALGNLNATKNCGFANLRKTNERQVAHHLEPASKPVE